MSGELAMVDPAIGWSMRVAFGGEKQPRDLVAQFHVPVSATPAQINALLDKVARAQDRLIRHYKLVELRERFKSLVDLIGRYEHDLVLVEETARARWAASGRRGEWSLEALSGQERQAKNSVENSLKQSREQALRLQAEITELEAADAAECAADRGAGEPGG